jgi:hypothetical protein
MISFIKRNPILITVVVCLIAITSIYFYKDIQSNKRTNAIKASANQQLQQTNHNMLKLVAKPMVWGIRTEMLRGNLEQVNLFLSDMVKEKNFQYIILVDPSGNILLSTDKKLEGQSATGMYADSLLQTDSIRLVTDSDHKTTLFAPVMGFDKKLGTLLFKYYTPDLITEHEKKEPLTQ